MSPCNEFSDFEDEDAPLLTPNRLIFLTLLRDLEDEERAEELTNELMDALFSYAEDNFGVIGAPCIVLDDGNGVAHFADMDYPIEDRDLPEDDDDLDE